MALNCKINERIFTFEGKDYNYNEFRALMYDGLLERIPELTAETKEALKTEEGKEKVKKEVSRRGELGGLKRGGKKPSKKGEVKDQAFDGIEEPKTPIGDTKTVMVDGKERTVFNSQGKPIHPTVEGVRNFWRWFGDSKVVDEQGRPLVVYHGTGSRKGFYVFKGHGIPGWFSVDREQAQTYGDLAVEDEGREGDGRVYEVYLKIDNPVDLDAIGIDMNAWMSSNDELRVVHSPHRTAQGDRDYAKWQREAKPFPIGAKRYNYFREIAYGLVKSIGIDMGPNTRRLGDMRKSTTYIAYEFFNTEDFARDAAQAGYNGIKVREGNLLTFGAFNRNQIKSATDNYGTFDASEESINKMKSPREEKAENENKMAKTGSNRMSNHGAKRLLGLIKPKLKVVEFAENEVDKFNETYKRLSGNTEIVASKEYDGFYDSSGDGTVYLIAKPGQQRVLAHEVMHPVFNVLFKGNPKLVDDFYAQIKADERLKKYIEFGARYEPGMTEKMEAITDFLGAVADGELDEIFKKDPSLKQMVIDFIKKLLGYVGLSKDVEISGDMDMMTLASLINDAVRYNARLRVENISAEPESGVYTHIFGPTGKLTTQERDGLAAAMAAHQNGATQEETKKLNGWFIGPDGKWRKYSEPFQAKLIGSPSDPDWILPMGFDKDGNLVPGTVLQDIYDFPELYKKYPTFKYIPVELKILTGDQAGHAGYWDGGRIVLNKKYANNSKYILETIAHEAQHAIQQEEGFVPGANKQYALYLLNKEQRKTYVNYVKNILDAAEKELNDYGKLNNFLSQKNNKKELVETFNKIEYAAIQMDSGLWEEAIDELIEKAYGKDFQKKDISKYSDIKAEIESTIEQILANGATGQEVIDLMAKSFGRGIIGNVQVAKQFIELAEKDIYSNTPKSVDYLLEIDKIAKDHVRQVDLDYLAYYMSYGEAEARLVGERAVSEKSLQKEGETISPIEKSKDGITKAGEEMLGQLSVYAESDARIAALLSRSKGKTFVASMAPEAEGELFFAKKAPSEKKLIPQKDFNNAIDSATTASEKISDENWSAMSQEEKAKITYDAAKASLDKDSSWYQKLDLEGKRAALKELRSDIYSNLGAKMPTKAEAKAEKEGRRKGVAEGRAEGRAEEKKASEKKLEREKELRKEQRTELKEQIKTMRQRMNELFDKVYEASKKGAIAGEIHGRREERKRAEAELSKKLNAAEVEKNKLAQKRLMQGYAQGIADGTLGGEVMGTRRGRKQARQEMSKERKQFSELVRELFWDINTGKLLLRGTVGRLQAYSIGRAAAMVDPGNPKHIVKFKDMVIRILENANYAADLSDAKKANRKARKLSKSKALPLNHREALAALAAVDVSMISDPREYADRVVEYFDIAVSVKKDQYEQRNSSEMEDFAEKLAQENIEQYRKLLMDEYGLDDIGYVDPKELYDALESGVFDAGYKDMSQEKREAVRKKVKTSAEYAKIALDEWIKDARLQGVVVGQELSPTQSRIVDRLAKADFDNMGLRQMMQYIKVVDNIVMNDSFDNAERAAIVADISANLEDAFKSINPSTVRALKGIRMQTMSIADLNRYFWGLNGIFSVVQEKLGVGRYINAKENHNKAMNEVGQKVTEFYRELYKKDPNAFSKSSMALEGAVAYVIQSMPGMSVVNGFEARKKILLENIAELSKRNDDKYREQAKLLQKAYDEVIKDAKLPNELLGKLQSANPAIYESIEFLINVTKPYKEAIRENSRTLWDEGGNRESGTWDDPHYIPIAYTKIAERATDTINEEDVPKATKTMLKTLPQKLKERVRYNQLPENKLIDLNPRGVTLSSLNRNLFDAIVGESLTYIAEFMDTPGVAENVFGGKDNKEYYRENLHRWVAKYYQAERQDKAGKVINRAINGMREMAVAVRLGTVLQPVKQMPEALTQSVILTGNFDGFTNMFKLGGPMKENGAIELMSKYAIGDRGSTIAGNEWEGIMSKHYRDVERALLAKGGSTPEKTYRWLRGALMKPLSASDGLVAKAAWMAHYEYQRNKQGFKVKNWDTEANQHDSDPLRQQAAIYAETMVDYTMVSSDPTKASVFATKGKNWGGNLAKAMFFIFSGFSIQSVSRLRLDMSDLHRYRNMKNAGNPNADKVSAGRSFASLAARTSGAAVYWSTVSYLVPMLVQGMANLWVYLAEQMDDDDDDDKTFEFIVTAAIAMHYAGLLYGDVEQSITLAAQQKSKETIEKKQERLVTALTGDSGKYKEIMAGVKEKELSQKSLDAWNRWKVGVFSSMIGADVQQTLNAGIIDGINYVSYVMHTQAKDPSTIDKKGGTKSFESWIKDQENPVFYRYEYKYGKTVMDEQNMGLFDIVLGTLPEAKRKLDKTLDMFEKAEKNEWDILPGESGEAYKKRISEYARKKMDEQRGASFIPTE